MFAVEQLFDDVTFFDEQVHTIHLKNAGVPIAIDGSGGSGCGENDGDLSVIHFDREEGEGVRIGIPL